MKRFIGLIVSVATFTMTLSVGATLVVDNFDRDNTSLVTSNDVPATLGGDWIMGQGQDNAQVRILENQLRLGITGNAPWTILLNTGVETVSGSGNSFSLAVTSDTIANVNNMPGLAWNFQSPGNYYYLRYNQASKVVQFFRVLNGSIGPAIGSISATGFADYVAGARYRYTVASSNPYEFDITVEEIATGLTASDTLVDPWGQFTGGYAGIASGGGQLFYDDFRLERIEVLPEPNVLLLFGGKAEEEP